MVNLSAVLLEAAQELKFAATSQIPLFVQEIKCPAQSATQSKLPFLGLDRDCLI